MNAIDFLKATNTSFKSEYKGRYYYFPDDKEEREVYYITLKNDRHKFKFTFGQSIFNTGKHPEPYDVLACLTKYDPGTFEDFCNEYGYNMPDKEELFQNLIKSQSVQYRKSVRYMKAEHIYKKVLKEYENVCKLFTSEEIELLQEIT